MGDTNAVLEERGSKYGKFTGHAAISQNIQEAILLGCVDRGDKVSFDELLEPDQREALFMIAHKIGRIINGDPDYADSWIDIAGYATLVANRLEGEKNGTLPL